MSVAQSTGATREVVLSEMTRIAAEQGRALPAALTDDIVLLDTDLDSLCFAILVATLEDRLGVDPFGGDGPVDFPITVGELVAAYERPGA